ncbi:hypothetical protein [Mycobacterium sp. MYCO198283]|nr:hypothetical protein [Mycobacterium sp. MYCO198283]
MDSSNLFSHPQTAQHVAREANNEPVEMPVFSDAPGATNAARD